MADMIDGAANSGGDSEEFDLDAVLDAALDGAEAAEGADAGKASGEPNKTDSATPDDGDAGGEEEAKASEDGEDGKIDGDTESDDIPTVRAPEDWSDADRTMFEGLDDKAKHFLLRRHREMTADYTRKNQGVADIVAALEPVSEEIALAGSTPAAAVTQLVAAHRFLKRDPARAVQWLAQSYGVDLGQLNPAAGEGEFVDPQIAQLRQQVTQLSSLVQTSQASAGQSALQAEIDKFRSETDAEGSPVRPHYERVKQAMGVMLMVAGRSGQEMTLSEAYERAVRADPELFREVSAADRAKAAAAAEAKRKADIEKAKAAGKPVRGKGGTFAKAEVKDIDDAINRAFESAA